MVPSMLDLGPGKLSPSRTARYELTAGVHTFFELALCLVAAGVLSYRKFCFEAQL